MLRGVIGAHRFFKPHLLFHTSSRKLGNEKDFLNFDIRKLREFKQLDLAIDSTQKEHLKLIQTTFGSPRLSFDREVYKTKTRYIFSNDYVIPGYVPTLLKCFSEETILDTTYRLGDALRSRKPEFKVGIIVGNGSVLSLLPEIPAQDIILLDIDPAVHYFILYIKILMLACKDYKDFSAVREILIEKINTLAHILKPRDEPEFVTEMDKLGDLHFLANEERFRICIDALLKKDLIPINKVNIFLKDPMYHLIRLLNQSNCRISFMNLTNVAEYDKERILYSIISKMSFAQDFKVLLTSHFLDGKGTYLAKNLSDLKTVLDMLVDNSYKLDLLAAANELLNKQGLSL